MLESIAVFLLQLCAILIMGLAMLSFLAAIVIIVARTIIDVKAMIGQRKIKKSPRIDISQDK